MNGKIIKKYCREAGRYCPTAYRKRLKNSLYDSLTEFCELHPDCSEADIIAHFGRPEQCSTEYIATLDSEEQARLVLRSQFLKLSVLIALITVVLIVAGGMAWLIVDDATEEPYHYDYSYHYVDGGSQK